MLRTYCAIHLPVITRIAPMAILTRLPATLIRRHYNISKSIFDPDDEDERRVKKIHQLPDDQPWDGDEPVKHSVLRMIMDKYRAPLRVEGAAKRNLPKPQSNWEPQPPQEKSSQKKKMEREVKLRELKQNRIMNAKDAAFHYSSERKYPTPLSDEKTQLGDNVKRSTTKSDIEWEDWDLRKTPISINEIGIVSDEKIRYAQAKGVFDDLPGRGKPIPDDPLIRNPFIDRTEYFLNRIIQRNSAAPPWIMMQQEVDNDIATVRSQLNTAIKKCLDDVKANNDKLISKTSLLRRFESLEKSYFDKELDRLNMRVRSYNVMCPEPVRKQLLELDKELKDVIKKHGF